MRLSDGREVGLPVGVEEAVDDAAAAAGRQVDRQALLAERRLDRRQETRQVDILHVDLVDDDEAAEPALRRPIHHPRRDHLDARLRAHHHRRRLHGVERTDRLPDEIGEAGRVDQVDARVLRVEVQNRRAQRVLPRLLQRIEIADRRAALDRAGLLDGAGREQQRLGERGLAGSPLADKRDRTDVARGVVRHSADPLDGCSRKLYRRGRSRRRARPTLTSFPDMPAARRTPAPRPGERRRPRAQSRNCGGRRSRMAASASGRSADSSIAAFHVAT